MFDLSLIGAAAFLLTRQSDGEFVYAGLNSVGERLTGLRRVDILGKTAIEVFGAETGEVLMSHQMTCAQSRSQVDYETPAMTPLGERHYQSTLTPMISPDGKVTELFGVTADISKRKRLEDDLRIANLRLNLAMEALGGAHWFYDTALQAFELSPAFENLLGPGTPRVMSVAEWQQHVIEEDRDDTCFANLLAGRIEEGTAEFRIYAEDGRPDGSAAGAGLCGIDRAWSASRALWWM